MTLIERTNRQVMLTPVGESIVEQAQRVLDDVDRLVGVAEQHRDPLGGNFRLGIIPTVAPYLPAENSGAGTRSAAGAENPAYGSADGGDHEDAAGGRT